MRNEWSELVHKRMLAGLNKQGGEENADPGGDGVPTWDEIRERAAAVVPHRMQASDVPGAEEVLMDMARRAEAEGHAEAVAIYRGAIVVVKLTEGKARMKQWKDDEEGAVQALAEGVAKVESMMVQAAAIVGGGATEEGVKEAPEGGDSKEESGAVLP